MKPQKRPHPDGKARTAEAVARRQKALNISKQEALNVPANQEEVSLHNKVPLNFTKGLPHNEFGLVDSLEDYHTFVDLLTQDINPASVDFPAPIGVAEDQPFRAWESPLGGHYFDLQGPDPAAVAMPPAPKAGASELCAEMAEVYAMALTRDVPFEKLTDGTTKLDKNLIGINLEYPADSPIGKQNGGKAVIATLNDLVRELNKLPWFSSKGAGRNPISSFQSGGLNAHETRRRNARFIRPDTDELTPNLLYRGSTNGSKTGSYLSQFLLLGTQGKANQTGNDELGNPSAEAPPSTHHGADDGIIVYGANAIDQRIYNNKPKTNYMTDWESWLNVQKGLDVRGHDAWQEKRGFVETLRDLATYVHFDQLYQAYFNACLLLLENKAPFDPGFPAGSTATRGAFATFGGPHILSLMTEVATRALKAVRRQKFQIHRRARPEVVAGRFTLAANNQGDALGAVAKRHFHSMLKELGYDDPNDEKRPGILLYWISKLNAAQNSANIGAHGTDIPAAFNTNPNGISPHWMDNDYADGTKRNYLLPMAFPEGSPMHPSYGAGHATVAVACVTILKAFFDMGHPLHKALGLPEDSKGYVARDGKLVPASGLGEASLGDELDKLAANIAIGRNIAGVHYYTDYYDSVRMGERIAVGILKEQMLTYPEKVSMTFQGFDGEEILIKTEQDHTDSNINDTYNHVLVKVKDQNGQNIDFDEWWLKNLADF